MKNSAVLESDLRSILRDEERFPLGTVSFCEWARGGDPGLPDTWVAVAPLWAPVELKRGRGVIKGLRPSQRRWHKTSLLLNVPTFGLTYDGTKVYLLELKLDDKRRLTEMTMVCWQEKTFNYEELVKYLAIVY